MYGHTSYSKCSTWTAVSRFVMVYNAVALGEIVFCKKWMVSSHIYLPKRLLCCLWFCTPCHSFVSRYWYKYHIFLLHEFVSRTVWNKRKFTAVSKRSQYSSVNILTRLWAKLRCHSSIPGRGKSFVSCSTQPDWLWGLPNLLHSGYQGQGGWGMKPTSHPHLIPRWRVREALLLYPA